MRLGLAISVVLPLTAHLSTASAQEGLATSSSLQGHNTIQQAPSGGAAGGAPGAGLTDRATQGQPTAEDRRVERRDNAATQICKGC